MATSTFAWLAALPPFLYVLAYVLPPFLYVLTYILTSAVGMVFHTIAHMFIWGILRIVSLLAYLFDISYSPSTTAALIYYRVKIVVDCVGTLAVHYTRLITMHVAQGTDVLRDRTEPVRPSFNCVFVAPINKMNRNERTEEYNQGRPGAVWIPQSRSNELGESVAQWIIRNSGDFPWPSGTWIRYDAKRVLRLVGDATTKPGDEACAEVLTWPEMRRILRRRESKCRRRTTKQPETTAIGKWTAIVHATRLTWGAFFLHKCILTVGPRAGRCICTRVQRACRRVTCICSNWDDRLGRMLVNDVEKYADAREYYKQYANTCFHFSFLTSYLVHSFHTLTSLVSVIRHNLVYLVIMLSFIGLAESAGDSDGAGGRSRPPMFTGERAAFTAWLIQFTIWLALHAPDCTEVLEGDEPEPTVPDIIDTGVTTEMVCDATKLLLDWQKRNRKLFGALGTAMPEWLATSLYTSQRNDGVGALSYLRTHFDSQAGNGNDRAAALQRLQASYIDTRNDLNENDVRHQYDNMMIAVQDIVSAGGTRPDDLLLISMFENAMPTAYSVIKQMTRRMSHDTLLAYYNDLLAQTRAEVASRAPAVHAFGAATNGNMGTPDVNIDMSASALAAMGLQRLPAPPGGGRGGAKGGKGRGRGAAARGRGGAGRGSPASTQHPTNPCLRCGGEDGHNRANCTAAKTLCRFCGVGDHVGAYCPKNPTAGARRNALSPNAKAIVDREAGNANSTPPNAMDACTSQQQLQQNQPPAPMQPPSLSESSAHAAAAAAASAQTDPVQCANAYSATLRAFGYGMCVSAMASAPESLELPGSAGPPPASVLISAMVDTMATYFVVNRRDFLVRITNSSPGFTVLTAAGAQPILAVGDAHVWMPDSLGKWTCYEVPNVLLMPDCSSILYSVRVMRDNFGFKHDFDSSPGVIVMPGYGGTSTSLPIRDNGAAFSIPVAFSTIAQPPKSLVRSSRSRPAALLVSDSSAFPADTVGTPQSLLYQRLGFPYAQQWRYVGASTAGHNLPPNVVMSTTLPVREAVMRGRARALPFLTKHPTDRTPPPPGAVVYMDFAGPMVPSFPHGYIAYCGATCAGSIYGRVIASHSMKKEVASATLAVYIADVSAKMGSAVPLKPSVVNCDNGSAFVSQHFRELLAERQIQLRFSPPYTPQLNGHVEAMWGTTFGTARVLLAAANLPPSMHPFAMQCARWIENRLPKPTRGHQSPVYMLSKQLPDLSHLYTFGCLCLVTLPKPLRSGDKHFMDRGAPGLYLGPSEEGQCHVVYVFALRRVLPVAKIRVWEDEFPGLRGEKYRWFPDDPSVGQGGSVHGSTTGSTTTADEPSGFMRGPSQDDPTNPTPGENSDNTAPHYTPPSPMAPSPQPRVTHPDSSRSGVPSDRTPPYSAGGTANHGYEPFNAGPSRSIQQELQSAGTGHQKLPKGDSGNSADPTSRTFARQLPVRTTRASNPNYASTAGKAAISAAVSIFACLAAMDAHVRSTPGSTPSADFPNLSPMAFANHACSVDAAFIDFASTGSDESVIHACEVAAHIFSVSIVSTTDLGDIPLPRGYRQAMTCAWSEYWKDAIAKEIAGLMALRTWDLVLASKGDEGELHMPSKANLMRCHYVLTVKRQSDGAVEKFKARLVADGNTQQYGVDFNRVFSTVVKSSTIRLVLIVAAAHDYNLTQIDIRQAYLQAELTEDLYMIVPPGIPAFDERGRPLVCKLRRTLYGLKQAGREWGMLFSAFLVSWGFVRSTIDTCLFTYTKGSHILWILVYVDDCLILENDSALRSRFVADLGKRFPVDDRGELEWLLGVAIDRERIKRVLSLSQELYIKDLVEKYASHVRAGHTRRYDSPMEEGLRLSADDCPAPGSEAAEQMVSKKLVYMALVGAFLWLSNMTRSEISHVTSQLARFVSNPGIVHFNAAMRVLIYLDGTRSRKLRYEPDKKLPLHVLVDSSWETRFSCSGAYFFFMGCPFHWFSKMQRSVTLSSCEAEFFGCMLALKDVLWIRQVLLDLHLLLPGPSLMWCDSKSAVAMAFDPVAFKNTKHIQRAAEFLRHHTLCGSVTIEHAKGVIMIADILTKGQARPLFLQLLKLLDEYSKNSIIDLKS